MRRWGNGSVGGRIDLLLARFIHMGEFVQDVAVQGQLHGEADGEFVVVNIVDLRSCKTSLSSVCANSSYLIMKQSHRY